MRRYDDSPTCTNLADASWPGPTHLPTVADTKDIWPLTRRVTTSKEVYIDVHDRREKDRNTVSGKIDE